MKDFAGGSLEQHDLTSMTCSRPRRLPNPELKSMLKPTYAELQQGASPIAGEAEEDLSAVCERTRGEQLLHVPAPCFSHQLRERG